MPVQTGRGAWPRRKVRGHADISGMTMSDTRRQTDAHARRWQVRPLALFLVGGCTALASFLAGMHWNLSMRSAPLMTAPALAGTSPTAGHVPHRHTLDRRPPDPDLRVTESTGMAGEFQRQSAIILSCAELVEQHPETFVELVARTHTRVRLIGLVSSHEQRRLAEYLLTANGLPASAVAFLLNPVRTMWIRDYGPQFIRRPDGRAEVLDVISGVDAECVDAAVEDPVPEWISRQLGLPVMSVPLRLQGGNFLTNGDGLCVTSNTLLKDNSDLGYGADLIRTLLRLAFGCGKWVCLRPLEGEETQHVDMFVTFLAEDIAVVAECDPLLYPSNAAILDEAAHALAKEMTCKGPMRVYRIPMPVSRIGRWRSYTNVLFANGVLLVPTYSNVDLAKEREAFDLYQRLLPGWEIVGINADNLIRLGGALHCVAANVPDFVQIDPIRFAAGAGQAPARLGEASLTEARRQTLNPTRPQIHRR